MKYKEIVQIEKKTFDRMSWDLAKFLLDYFKKEYGYKLISREDDKELNLFSEFGEYAFVGFLTTGIEKFIKEFEGE